MTSSIVVGCEASVVPQTGGVFVDSVGGEGEGENVGRELRPKLEIFFEWEGTSEKDKMLLVIF